MEPKFGCKRLTHASPNEFTQINGPGYGLDGLRKFREPVSCRRDALLYVFR
jgi:hypothetical protein